MSKRTVSAKGEACSPKAKRPVAPHSAHWAAPSPYRPSAQSPRKPTDPRRYCPLGDCQGDPRAVDQEAAMQKGREITKGDSDATSTRASRRSASWRLKKRRWKFSRAVPATAGACALGAARPPPKNEPFRCR